MPLWKTADTSTDDAKPLYANNDPSMNLLNIFANNSGWWHRVTYTDTHSNTRNKDELMVAIGGLGGDGSTAVKLGQPTISDVRFSRSTVGTTGAAANVIVTWNEQVQVIGANVLTLTVGVINSTANVIGGAGANANTVTASYVSGSGTNRLRFAVAIDANAAVYTLHTATISNTADLALVDAGDEGLTANLSIVAAKAGSNSSVGTLTAS